MANGKIAGTSGPSQVPEKNLQGLMLPVLPQPEQPDEVQDLYRIVVDKGREAMGWYSRNMAVRKKWGQRLRMLAIFLTSLASITPILVQLLPNEQAYQKWGLLASVFAVLGATCVGLDNYFGASSGWMRYVSAYQEINAKLEALQFGWARLALAAHATPKEQRLTSVMDLLQGFIVDVNATVRQETQDWMAEFRGSPRGAGATDGCSAHGPGCSALGRLRRHQGPGRGQRQPPGRQVAGGARHGQGD